MAKLETEHVFNGSIQQVFKGITDYSKYHKYLPGVTGTKVLPAAKTESICQVRYEINIIKSFYYILNMYTEEPHKIWWDLEESNLMKANTGSWELKETTKDKTSALYTLEVKFRGLVPGAITDQVAKANLGAMLKGFQKIIDEHQ